MGDTRVERLSDGREGCINEVVDGRTVEIKDSYS